MGYANTGLECLCCRWGVLFPRAPRAVKRWTLTVTTSSPACLTGARSATTSYTISTLMLKACVAHEVEGEDGTGRRPADLLLKHYSGGHDVAVDITITS